jgi:hypothetical protein
MLVEPGRGIECKILSRVLVVVSTLVKDSHLSEHAFIDT